MLLADSDKIMTQTKKVASVFITKHNIKPFQLIYLTKMVGWLLGIGHPFIPIRMWQIAK